MEEQLKKIRALVNEITTASSPDRIADLRIDLAGYKAYLGEQLILAEMDYNQELNQAMNAFDLSAAKAEIQVKASEKYRTYAQIKQMYNDVKTVISAARTKLAILEDDKYN